MIKKSRSIPVTTQKLTVTPKPGWIGVFSDKNVDDIRIHIKNDYKNMINIVRVLNQKAFKRTEN